MITLNKTATPLNTSPAQVIVVKLKKRTQHLPEAGKREVAVGQQTSYNYPPTLH
jgi:hypothetical protein